MRVYTDTSFLFSLYVKDQNSPEAIALANRLKFPIAFIVTPFHDFELNTAMELAVFRKQMTRAQATAARRDFESDLTHWTMAPFPPEVLIRAVTLARRHSARLGVRSLDILHVASALALSAEVFLTFDERQRRLAKAERRRVLP